MRYVLIVISLLPTLVWGQITKIEIHHGRFALSPTISADGQRILFVSADSIFSRGIGIYEATYDSVNQNWRKPILIRNMAFNELTAAPSMTADGNSLYFFKSVEGNSEIFVSQRNEYGWSSPTALTLPINTNGYEGFPSISPNGETLFFARVNNEKPRSPSIAKSSKKSFCLSIYTSKKDEAEKWSEPIKLPWPINQDCEKYPTILPDGKTLLFESNRPGGKGGYDIYISKVTEKGDWTFPEPLNEVNSKEDEFGATMPASGKKLYFGQKESIYSIETENLIKPIALFKGLTLDKETSNGIATDIKVESTYKRKAPFNYRGSFDGKFTISLDLGDYYRLTFNREGHTSIIRDLDLRKKTAYTVYSDTIRLTNAEFSNSFTTTEFAKVEEVERSYKDFSKKVALIIGVKTYQNAPSLINTINDAKDMSAALKLKGFQTIEVYDPKSKMEIREAVINYTKALRDIKDGVGLLFYSGHGLQVDGVNYLVPTLANLEIKADVEEQCMNLDYILRAMEENGNHLNIVILDACRNNPFRGFYRSNEVGLGSLTAPKGSYIVYATKPGSVASDGTGRNGLFTSKLLKFINQPNLNIEQVFKYTAAEVAKDSMDKQRPWISSDYTGDFFFTLRRD